MTIAEVIAEARRLDEAATKGPWAACEDEDGVPVVCLPPDHDGPIAWNIRGGPGGRADCLTLTPHDAAFIAFARTALPLLVAVAEAAVDHASEVRQTTQLESASGWYASRAPRLLRDVQRFLIAFDAALRGEGQKP